MPTSALDNPLILPILGLLAQRPRHPYAVFTELRRRYPYLRVRNATVYTLLDTLRGQGWVAAADDDGPDALRVTGDGAGALATRAEEEISGGDLAGGPSALAALACLPVLPPARAVAALHTRVSAIAREGRRLRRVLSEAGGSEPGLIELHYLLARLEHDRKWLTALAVRIENGELPWSGELRGAPRSRGASSRGRPAGRR